MIGSDPLIQKRGKKALCWITIDSLWYYFSITETIAYENISIMKYLMVLTVL